MQFSSLQSILSLLWLLIVVGLSRADDAAQVGCRDENGNLVDWYIAYKFPQIDKTDAKFQSGYAYAYFTSSELSKTQDERREDSSNQRDKDGLLARIRSWLKHYINNPLGINWKKLSKSSGQQPSTTRQKDPAVFSRWVASDHLVTEQKSVVMQTLAVAYDERYTAQISSIHYNDQPPKMEGKVAGLGATRAHAKGVVLLDEKADTGIWLTHTVPRFPPKRASPLKFQSNAAFFGQTFMCVTFGVKNNGKKIVDHLVNMRPLVYETKISDSLYQLIPDLKHLTDSMKRLPAKMPRAPKLAQSIETKGGQKIDLYSKSSLFESDIYADWIEQELKSSLYVESWREGAGTPLNSSCPTDSYHTNNVKDLTYDKSTSWSYLLDHSKWAISDDAGPGFVCLGDMNRMKSQFKRGGGAACMKCPSCWNVFSATILDIEPCASSSQKS